MWKPILGSDNYEIECKSGIVRNIDTRQEVESDKEGRITLNVRGDGHEFECNWLKYLAYFEYPIEIILKLRETNGVRFHRVDPRIVKLRYRVKPKMIVPYYVTDTHRLVPSFPSVAVNENGEVITTDGQVMVKHYCAKGNFYLSVDIYDPDRSFKRSIAVHRLVAEAWVENDDIYNKCIVNHLDGDKFNLHRSNFEWCTVAENNRHAAQTGLSQLYINGRVRDVETGVVHTFERWSDLAAFVGAHNRGSQALTQRHISIPYRGRYEIRVGDDDRDWYFEDKEPSKLNGRYLVTVVDNDSGEVNEFRDTRVFRKHYRLWNLSGLPEHVAELKRRQPNLTITVVDTYNVFKVQMMDLHTEEVTTFDSIREASRETGIDFPSIQRRLRPGKSFAVGDKAFRRECPTPWKKSDVKQLTTSIQGVHAVKDDGVTKTFRSLKETARFFNVDRSVIKHRIRTATPLNNYHLNYASPLLS